MRWEDERYVRLYTRDTVNWKLLPWQSKCVLPLIMRRLDRAGILELGGAGLEGIAALIEVPIEIVEPGVKGAVERSIFLIANGALVMPNFLEAQETKVTDAQRQRDLRERRRAQGLARSQSGGEDAWVTQDKDTNQVTEGHKVTNQVTEGHSRSQQVTLAVPSRAVPNQPSQPEEKEIVAYAPPLAPPEPSIPGELILVPDIPEPTPETLRDLWNASITPGMPRWRKTEKERRKTALAALRERRIDGEEGWEAVFRRIASSAFLCGSKGWAANPDWALKAKNANSILEGAYDNRSGPSPPRDVRKGVVRAEDMNQDTNEVDAYGNIRL